jgi:hypothetical protein
MRLTPVVRIITFYNVYNFLYATNNILNIMLYIIYVIYYIVFYIYVGTNISDPGEIPKCIGNIAGFIYSLRDVEC